MAESPPTARGIPPSATSGPAASVLGVQIPPAPAIDRVRAIEAGLVNRRRLELASVGLREAGIIPGEVDIWEARDKIRVALSADVVRADRGKTVKATKRPILILPR